MVSKASRYKSRIGAALIILIGAVVIILLADAEIGWADASNPANPDYVLMEMKNIVNGKIPELLKYARNLFMSLSILSLGIGLAGMLLSGESNLGSVAAHVTKWIIYVGFFMWVMGADFFIPHIIVGSFEEAAHNISGVELKPGDILIQGIKIYGNLLDAANALGWTEYIVAGLSGIVIIVVFGVLAATLAVAFVEMYLIICGGCILLGFAGIDYTKDIAMGYLKYSVSVGAKILVIALVAAVAKEMTTKWAESLVTIEKGDFFTVLGYLIGGSLTLMLTAQMVPGIAQGMISGASVASGGMLRSAAAAPLMAAAAAGGAIRAGASGISNTIGAMKSSAQAGGGTLRGAIASGMNAGMQARAGGASLAGSFAQGLGAAAKAKPFESLGAGAKYATSATIFGSGSWQAKQHLDRKHGGYVDPP